MPDLLTLGDTPLAQLLSDGDAARLRQAATRVNYADGQLIHSRGDAKAGFSIVVSGAVRFVKRNPDGGELTVSLLGPGHSFGEATIFAGQGRAYDAVAVGETVIDQLSKPAFERLIVSQPEIASALLAATTCRLYAVLSFLDDLRSSPLPVRAAKLILDMLRSSKEPDRVSCTQQDLAYTLGVSRVSIGKALSKLQSDKVISLGYGEIQVPDSARLLRWIEKNSAT